MRPNSGTAGVSGVGVGVDVMTGVGVGVAVGPAVGVAVGVGEFVGVGVGVLVGVGVGTTRLIVSMETVLPFVADLVADPFTALYDA